MHGVWIYIIGAVVLAVVGYFAQQLLQRSVKAQLPLIPAHEASVKPLTPRQRGLLLVLMMVLLIVPPVFLCIFLIRHLSAVVSHLAPSSAVAIYITGGVQASVIACFFFALIVFAIMINAIFERLPLAWRRQLGETPLGGRAAIIGIGSVLTLLMLVTFAGLQSYVAFTPQGIIENRFFAVTDHLTTYENLARVDIQCQPATYHEKRGSQERTKLLTLIDAYDKNGERIKFITKADDEGLYIGRSDLLLPKLTPQAARGMRQLLSKHHVLAAVTPCSDIYEPQMTPSQLEYYWALFGGGYQSAAPHRSAPHRSR